MDFGDTQEEAQFRAEARAWIAAEAPTYLTDSLTKSGFGGVKTGDFDPMVEAKLWQRKRLTLVGPAFNGRWNLAAVVPRLCKASFGIKRKGSTANSWGVLSSARVCARQP